MRAYSIRGVPYGYHEEVEICQVDTNPDQVAAGAAEKTISITTPTGRKVPVQKWQQIRVVELKPRPF